MKSRGHICCRASCLLPGFRPVNDSASNVAEVGLQTFVDLLEFVGSLILSEGEGIHLGLDIFGLSLLQAALNTGAQALARCAASPARHVEHSQVFTNHSSLRRS